MNISLNSLATKIPKEEWIKKTRKVKTKNSDNKNSKTYPITVYEVKQCKDCDYYQYCRTDPDVNPTDDGCISFTPRI